MRDACLIDEGALDAAKALLIHGVQTLGLCLSAAQVQACIDHLTLLERWNRTHNLTALSRIDEMVVLHTLDALSVATYFQDPNQQVLDVGTGGGLPGIPLSIVCANSRFTLLDANHKKTSFVRACVAQLGLKNCDVVTQRVENYLVERGFDVVTLRAFAHPGRAMDWVAPVLRSGGRLVLMLGKAPSRKDFDHVLFKLSSLEPVQVPNLQAQRHVAVVIRR